ncbi:hypothetical protein SAMN04488053_10921 [Alkalicoccus daliensis]|uniref:Pyridoxamine 5'-phosphate oxidase N-terminal domain-containing protein n=1 Tax=Alkalicoccus daliensis TaxID=745820 RepID=A0A1H0HSH2_9BACI|nr:hypothetical protein SAMN04488053_10921 [Alkalicoccus daliensis]
MWKNIIQSKAELRELLGEPSELAQNKVIDRLDEHCRNFIAQSPFVLLGTSGISGRGDVSPRGDAPGFVKVVNEKHLVIPERPGNKRVDSLQNILENPQVGLLFFIPGLGETLRINGKAVILKDPELLETMAVNKKVPLLGIGVEAEECFIHCAKAFKRSQLWEPESWPEKAALPSAARMIKAHADLEKMTEAELEDRLQKGYEQKLY